MRVKRGRVQKEIKDTLIDRRILRRFEMTWRRSSQASQASLGTVVLPRQHTWTPDLQGTHFYVRLCRIESPGHQSLCGTDVGGIDNNERAIDFVDSYLFKKNAALLSLQLLS
jgi:hypothetical protein